MASKALTTVRALLVFPGLDRSAIDEDCRNIQTRDRNHRAWHVLVAAAKGEKSVNTLRLADCFDGVGDDFTGNERVFHAFGAHRDAVADRDGAEDLRHGSCCAQRCDRTRGQIVQAKIAGSDGAVTIGYSNDRLGEIFIMKAYGAQHGAISRPFDSLGDCLTATIIHSLFSSQEPLVVL